MAAGEITTQTTMDYEEIVKESCHWDSRKVLGAAASVGEFLQAVGQKTLSAQDPPCSAMQATTCRTPRRSPPSQREHHAQDNRGLLFNSIL